MTTTYIRNRQTGERSTMAEKTLAELIESQWEYDTARNPDAPEGWRGTFPFIGSEAWITAHPGKFAIVNVELQENGEYLPKFNPTPWQAIHPTGRCETFPSHGTALAHVLKIADCNHAFDLRNKCILCGCHSSDIAHFKQRMNP